MSRRRRLLFPMSSKGVDREMLGWRADEGDSRVHRRRHSRDLCLIVDWQVRPELFHPRMDGLVDSNWHLVLVLPAEACSGVLDLCEHFGLGERVISTYSGMNLVIGSLK